MKDGLVKVQITVRGKYIDFELDYKAVPIGPAIISAVKPIEVMCTDTGQRVSIVLHNLRMVTDPSQLHLVFGNVSLDSTHRITVMSTMVETRVSFILPSLSEDVVGAVHFSLRSGNNSDTATTVLNCKDSRIANLLYILPAEGYAGEEIYVTFGVQNFGSVTPSSLQVFHDR